MEPKVCLALGGGAARGLAHLGVLRVFEEAGLPVHMIAGTSFGALIGGLYATRPDARHWMERVEEFLRTFRSRRRYLEFIRKMDETGGAHPGLFADMTHLVRKGYFLGVTATRSAFISEQEYEDLIYPLIPDISIGETQIPFSCVATDIRNGRRVRSRSGSLRRAVSASCALPGIFPPVADGDRLLVDGGWVERAPVRCGREMGADIVILVDVSREIPELEMNSGLDVVLRADAVTRFHLNSLLAAEADLVIHPAVNGLHWADFSNPRELFRLGEEAARARVAAIRQVIGQTAVPSISLAERIGTLLGRMAGKWRIG